VFTAIFPDSRRLRRDPGDWIWIVRPFVLPGPALCWNEKWIKKNNAGSSLTSGPPPKNKKAACRFESLVKSNEGKELTTFLIRRRRDIGA
jgi:hypothetical protein